MFFGKRFRSQPVSQRRRGLQQLLRLERLEQRVVFAGLAPVAVNDLYHAVADVTLEVAVSGVLANDSDMEGDTLKALEFRGPANGSLSLNSDGSFAYTPNPGFTGTDGFIYQVDDETSLSHLAVVTIHVTPSSNAAPQGENDSYSVAEDGLLGIGTTHGLLANDSDADGDPLQVILGTEPEHGQLELNADGSFTYLPAADFNGIDSFTYQVSDGTQTSDLIAVEIMVEPVNDAPLGTNDSYAMLEDETLTVPVDTGVLLNDSDIDIDPLEAVLAVGPKHGLLELNADGAFTYKPELNYNGTDAFIYQVSDGTAMSEFIVVEILVSAVNDLPIGTNDSYATLEDEALAVPMEMGVLTNDNDVDGDALEAILGVGPEHGMLELSANGGFTYTPDANFNGTDSFTYHVSDGTEMSELIVVEIMVEAVNDAPTGMNDSYAMLEDETLTVPMEMGVLTNDSDVDGDALEALLGVGPEHGMLELNANGGFTYTPDANYNGTDSFTYQVSDGTETSDLIVVEIMVEAVNDEPQALDDSYSTDINETLVVAGPGVLGNDTDGDGDILKAELVTPPTHGTLTLAEDGSFVYEPDANYAGTDQFSYRASDASSGMTAVVSILIRGENERPTAKNDVYRVNSGGELNIAAVDGVLRNDTDVNDDPLQAIFYRGPQHGTLVLNPDGSFIYAPTPGYSGLDSFLYRANDGALSSRLAAVTLRVNAVELTPESEPQSIATIPGPLPLSNSPVDSTKSKEDNHDAILGSLQLENFLLSEFEEVLAAR